MVSLEGASQRTQDIISEADQLFEAKRYIEAIDLYKAALNNNSRNVKAKYYMAECYRLSMDYKSAQFYYGDIAKTGNTMYPLAGFYFAVAQKLRGKYSDAITSFKLFRDLLRKEGFPDNKEYNSFYRQAKIEIDGCQLALNQITMEPTDFDLRAIASPLNSPYNDYAGVVINNDNIICITSARKSRGSITNTTFGESYADLYRFIRSDKNKWGNYDPKDRFSQVVNTKQGEGSGAFNKEKDKFYYTNCSRELKGTCHIYIIKLENKRWTEPQPLNANINAPGSSSRHPTLSPTGDTLFFASNREGTLGKFDLWMSINAGNDNWSPPVNLGSQINTPFNEISPFFSATENAFFFSSDGHRGFGGYDIYIARGSNLANAEIHNPGIPFNSNRDDIFLSLGSKKGTLSSNRDGGIGKLDIYEFDIRSKAGVSGEIVSTETVAGRNSLLTDDYNFRNENTDIINQIISRRISSSFSEVNTMLSTEQLKVYNELSEDDKERIDKIVNARIRRMSRSSLRSIRAEDEYYYQQLNANKRRQVDNIVTSYLEEQGLGSSISLSPESNEFYNSENPTDRERLDILISERLRTSGKYRPKSINYESLSKNDQLNVDGITLKYLNQKKSIEDMRLSVSERVFIRDIAGEKGSSVNVAVKEKLLELSREEQFQLLTSDSEFYEDLTPAQRQSLKNIAGVYLTANFNTFDQVVDQSDIDLFSKMGSAADQKVNKLILKLISNFASADAYRAGNFF